MKTSLLLSHCRQLPWPCAWLCESFPKGLARSWLKQNCGEGVQVIAMGADKYNCRGSPEGETSEATLCADLPKMLICLKS